MAEAASLKSVYGWVQMLIIPIFITILSYLYIYIQNYLE